MSNTPHSYTGILTILVITCVVAAFTAQPAVAQTAKNLKCKGCVNSKDIGNNQVKSADIQNGQVKNPDLGNNAVTGSKVKDGSITLDDLSPEVQQTVTDLQDQVTAEGETQRKLVCDLYFLTGEIEFRSGGTFPAECDLSCPCFDDTEVSNSSETSCQVVQSANGRDSLPDFNFRTNDTLLNTNEGVKRFTSCTNQGAGVLSLPISRLEAFQCRTLMEDVLGPCS